MRKLLVLLALCLVVGSASANINDYNTSLVLLMHMNQTAGSPSVFIDNSPLSKTITNAGAVTTNTVIKYLGNASGSFTGASTSYLTIPDGGSYDFGTSNFTIAFWFNSTSISNSESIISGDDGTTNNGFIVGKITGLVYYRTRGASYTHAPVTQNEWQHYEIIGNGTYINVYRNGVFYNASAYGGNQNCNLASLNIGRNGYATLAYTTGYLDELAIWKGVAVPISDLYPQIDEIGTNLTPPLEPPIASFSCTPTSTTLGTPITCADESSDTPTNWTYYWGDGNVTDGTQNPTYTYPFTGTFSINQTVNNTIGSSWYNRSNYITITNVTSFTQQDIYLTGQYTITFNVKRSTTNLPIANVTVVDAVSGQSYQSTNGTAFLTEPAGLIYVNFIADGYQTKQVTYVVDQDETHEVKLVPSASDPTPNTNVIYSPRLVRLRVVDNWRTPLTPVTITASYIADTLPNNDPTYLQNAFGISSTVAGLMMNSSVAMSGVTGIDGSNTFSMFPALTYNLTVTNETMGVHCQQNLAPADTDYVLFCPTDAQKAAVIPLSQTLNRSYIWVTEPNASFVTINASYQDLTGLTTNVKFNVSVVDNNTVIYSKNFGNPGTSQVLDNYTMPNIRGMQIKSYLAYNRSA